MLPSRTELFDGFSNSGELSPISSPSRRLEIGLNHQDDP